MTGLISAKLTCCPRLPAWLHRYARRLAAEMPEINMKLIRWNYIIDAAQRFYPSDPQQGVKECLQSCISGDPQYDGKNTLALSLATNYGWTT